MTLAHKDDKIETHKIILETSIFNPRIRMATLNISSPASETESDVKKMAKKKDERDGHEYEVKMVGDEVKWMCDMCEYLGVSSKAVKSHWTKKYRRAVQEEARYWTLKTMKRELKRMRSRMRNLMMRNYMQALMRTGTKLRLLRM